MKGHQELSAAIMPLRERAEKAEALAARDHDETCSVMDSAYASECAEVTRLRAENARLREALKGYEAQERSISEALNMGDGTYKP